MKLTQPLKWPGGKHYTAKWIVSLMPSRDVWCHYVEPYAGGVSVLLANDPEGISEVANDINGDLANFWEAIVNPYRFEEFRRAVEAIPFSEAEFAKANDEFNVAYSSRPIIDMAAKFFVRCRQSLAGRMKSFTGITKTRTRRGMNNEVSAWLTAIEGLPAVHERLKRVLILNRPAIEVVRSQDGDKTLVYADPPYLHETRSTKTEYGKNEMSEQDHEDLLAELARMKGRFLLSGYRSAMYDKAAEIYCWRRHEFEIANHAAGGGAKRRMTECVWTNY